MGLMNDQQLVQAFFTDGVYPVLHESIGSWGVKGGVNDFDVLGLKNRVEGGRKFRIVIVDQKADWRRLLFEFPHQLTGLLRHPVLIGVRRATCEMDLAATELDEHQNVKRFQEDRLDCEEIAGQDLVLIVAEELPPTG